MLAPRTVMRAFGITRATLGVPGMGGASPPWPERLAALGWQLLTPRLLRRGIYQARIENRSGVRPLIIGITREPFGERLRLWCPPGISAEDFHDAREILRAACYAADIRISRDDQRSDIVIVDIVRSHSEIGAGDDGRRDLGARP